LVGFRADAVKADFMRSLSKLKNAQPDHKNISVAHDLTPFQRNAVRKAVEEAKQQQISGNTDHSAENLRFKVVGLGSRVRVVQKDRN